MNELKWNMHRKRTLEYVCMVYERQGLHRGLP